MRAELLQQHLQLINQHVSVWLAAVHVLLEGQHERASMHKLLPDPAREPEQAVHERLPSRILRVDRLFLRSELLERAAVRRGWKSDLLCLIVSSNTPIC